MGGEPGSCPSCGADLVAGARFCAFCGTPVTGSEPAGDLPSVPREGRKVVTAMFADVVGSTPLGERLDPEDFSEVIGEAVRRMVVAVEEYGGRIREMAGDGVLALFGTPVAHEDDPERAALAALRIVETIREQASQVEDEWGVESFDVRVGIETGLVVLGVFGGGEALQFDAMGDTMNTTARLQSHADPGGVLVGPVTRRAIEPLFEWGDARTLELKGKADPVRASPLLRPSSAGLGQRSAAGLGAPLVGREHELAEVAGAVERLRGGDGGAVLIAGEAGIGKSRMLEEARALARGLGDGGGEALWLEGRCVSYGGTQPYLPFQGVLREIFHLSADSAPAEFGRALRDRAQGLLGDERTVELAPFLGTIMGVAPEPAERERLAAMPAEALHERVLEALLAVLARLAAERPLLVALEDLHWGDASSLRMAEGLLSAAGEHRLLVLITMRVEPDTPQANLVEHARRLDERARVIELVGLPAAADRALLSAIVGEGILPAKLAEELVERAAGNPFFLEEQVRSLVEKGALVRTDGRWSFEGEAAVAVPDTIEKLILSRVDGLDEPAHVVLAAAAVLGPELEDSLLAHVCEDVELREPLAQLMRLDLLIPAAEGTTGRHRFRHSMIQETVYGTLLKRRRRELHRRAARAIEAAPAVLRDERPAELARHYRLGGELALALPAHRDAGDAARRIYATDEALEHYSAALEIAAEPGVAAAGEDLYALRFGRGWILTRSGRLEEGGRDFEDAIELARRIGDREAEIEALNYAAIAHKLRDHRTAIRLHEEALAIATEGDDAAAEVTTLNHLALIHTNELRLDRALELGERALGIAESQRDDRLRAKALDSVKLIALHLGDLERLERVAAEEARFHLEREELDWAQWPLLEGAFAPLARAHWDEAERALSEALEVNRRIADSTSEPIFLDAFAWLHRSRGHYEEALRHGEAAVRLAEARRIPYWQPWAAATHGSTLLELDRADEAAPLLAQGMETAAAIGNLNQGIRCAGQLAWALWLLDDEEGSRAAAEQTQGWIDGVSCPPGGAFLLGAHGYLGLARAWLAGGGPERSESLIAPIHAAAARAGWKEFEASAGILLGRCLARRDDPSWRQVVESALALASEAGLPGAERNARAALAEDPAPTR